MKNRKIVTCLLLALVILFGNVLSVSAEETPNAETVRDEDNIFYDGLPEKDSNGYYHYVTGSHFTPDSGTAYTWRDSFYTPRPIAYYWVDNDTLSGYQCVSMGEYGLVDGFSGEIRDISVITYDDDTPSKSFDGNSSAGWLCLKGLTVWKPYVFAEQKTFFTNAPIFGSRAEAENYILKNDDSGVTNKKPVKAEKPDLYLKNIGWKTEAASGMGGKEDCVCTMTWDTDNLNENIFLNVRVDTWYQHYILGKKVSGIYDAIKMKQTDEFTSTTWSHGYLYKLDLLNGSFMYDYLTFPMLYGNTQEDLNNIYNGGVTSMYLQLVEVDKTTNTEYSGPWIRVNFKENSVSYPDISDISGGSINPDTGEFIVDPTTDYGESGYGVNGETGNVVQPGEVDLSSIDEIIPWFISKLRSMIGTLGEFPSLVAQVFSFLPDIIIWFIGVGIVIVIILRILGR